MLLGSVLSTFRAPNSASAQHIKKKLSPSRLAVQNHVFSTPRATKSHPKSIPKPFSGSTMFFLRFWSLLASVLVAFWLRFGPLWPPSSPSRAQRGLQSSSWRSSGPPRVAQGAPKAPQTPPRPPKRPLWDRFWRLWASVWVVCGLPKSTFSVQMLQSNVPPMLRATEPLKLRATEAPCFNLFPSR